MQAPNSPLDLLVVATHPDDAELGVGGTIVRCVADGLAVGILDLTSGEPTPHGDNQTRTTETAAATRLLGVAWRENLGLPNRSLESDLESRRQLASVFRLTRPRIILAPYWDDAHPDHVAASRLCDHARFWSKLTRSDIPGQPHWPERMYYYWSVHLRIRPDPSFVFDISETIEQKMQAVSCYRSQFLTGRSERFPTLLDDIRDRARYWGWAIGTAYGEPLASREEIGIRDLRNLV